MKVIKRVADIIFDVLLEHGIVDCFSVVGGGAMHLNNALAMNDSISKYFNHHEQACVMSAEAYYRISGKMASVCVTSGPGGTNALTGVLASWQDSIPVIIISGQVRQEISVEASGLNLRYRGIQEFDIISSVKNMTKYAKKIVDPKSVRMEVIKAIKLATSGRKGPVWIDIPLDVQSAFVDEKDLVINEFEFKQEELITLCTEYQKIIKSFKEAKRPIILAGRGIVSSGTLELFRKFCIETGVPVISTSISADNMYRSYERFYGFAGILGTRAGNFIIQNSDYILALGTSFGFTLTGYNLEGFAPDSKIVSVDIDKDEVRKSGLNISDHIQVDLKNFFLKIQRYVEQIEVSEEWISYCNQAKKTFTPFESSSANDDNERISSYRFWEIMEKYEPIDAIYALGNNTANTAKLQIGIKMKRQRILTNKNCGSMGYDLPAAVGASIALGKKQVYCVTGDGSIMMNIQELQTIVHYDLPVKIVIFSNDGYNAIRQTCKNFFNGKYIGCTSDTGISFPSFEQIADCFGFAYKRCRTNKEVEGAISWLVSSNERVILEVDQKYDDPIIPKLMSRLLPDGNMLNPVLHDMYPFLEKNKMKEMMRYSKWGSLNNG